MNNSALNILLLKQQQERILELEHEAEFYKDLCSKLSQPIKTSEDE